MKRNACYAGLYNFKYDFKVMLVGFCLFQLFQ